MTNANAVFVMIYQGGLPTNSIDGELLVWRSVVGSYMALLDGKDVTHRLPQERWAEIYSKAIAGQALLGRKPEIIEEIF